MNDRNRWGTVFVVAALVAIIQSSCTPAAPSVGDADAAADNGDAGVLPGAAPSLGCPAGCLAPAPAGWIGPSAVYDGAPETKPGACPVPYSVVELETQRGLVPAPAVCSCGAANFQDATCETQVENWNEPGCGTGGGFALNQVGNHPNSKCVAVLPFQLSWRVLPAVYKGGCNFGTPSKTLPPAVFEKTQLVCGLSAPAACAGRAECTGAPIAEGPFSRMCVRKEGDNACPSQDYAVRFVSHRGTSDTRACTACGAGKPKGTCGATTIGWHDSDCTGEQIVIATNACYPIVSPVRTWVDLSQTGVVNPTCEPEAGGNQPTGELAPTDPVTFCCNQ